MRSFAAGLTAAQLEQMLAPYIADRQTEADRDNPERGDGRHTVPRKPWRMPERRLAIKSR